MRDGDIRLKLDAVLQRRHAGKPGTLIRHEMGLCAGQRRIDMALLNGEIAGYEIKSDLDTLSRLAGQAETYQRVLDRMTLVTTARHKEEAMDLLPTSWGIIVACCKHGQIVLRTERKARKNTALDAYSLAQFLWRDEALQELKKRGLARGLSGKARHYMWVALAQAVPVRELRNIVRERVKARPGWLDGQPRGQGDVMQPNATSG